MKPLIIYLDQQQEAILSSCIDAAYTLGTPDALVFGKIPKDISGIHHLFHIPKCTQASIEDIAPIIERYAKDYTHLLLHADFIGHRLGSYLSGYLNRPFLSPIIDISKTEISYHDQDQRHTLKHPIMPILGIAGLYFRQKHLGTPKIQLLQDKAPQNKEDFTSKTAVLGLGLGAESELPRLKAFSDQKKLPVFGTKPLLDKGYITYKDLAGVSGRSIQTNLYLAFGISGDDYHMLGIQAKKIIAINPNPHAPIWEIADYGYIGKIEDILPLFEKYQLSVDIIA